MCQEGGIRKSKMHRTPFSPEQVREREGEGINQGTPVSRRGGKIKQTTWRTVKQERKWKQEDKLQAKCLVS